MRHTFRKKLAVYTCAACGLVLASCGKSAWTGEDAQNTTIGIDSTGRVTEVVIEEFSENYYDADELRSLIEGDIADYNAMTAGSGADEPPIVLEEIRREGENIRTTTKYQTAEDYGDFTLEDLYYGTVRQARLRGYELSSEMNDGAGGSYITSDSDDDNHLIVSDGHDRIVAPFKIIAVSDGVRLISETEADLSEAAGRSELLLER